MEAIHGVDASWLHRPRGNSPAPAPPMKVQSGPQTTEVIREVPKPERRQEIDPKPERRQEASVPASAQTPPKKSRPGLLGRASTDKRSSWMSNLSSKFSSSQSQQTGPSPTSAAVSKAQSIPLPASPSAKSMNGYFPTTIANNAQKDTSEEAIDDEYSPYIPQQPKAGGSFFSSALRRISTNNPARPQVGTGQGGVRPRKTLNVDTVRDRCAVKELEQLNLRRVSFRVDVELLGGSKYAAEGEPTERKKKIKDKKLKERAEGNALRKTSISLLETESDSDDVIQTAGAKLGSPPPNKVSWADDSKGDAAKTAEQKRPVQQGTLTNNGNPEKVSAPVDIVSNTSNTPAPDPRKLSLEGPPLKSDDKPTTDPLRVYRRCCQLREAPVLKRISEQLSNPNVYATESPGVVNCLNLNSSRMQAADIVCLGDWLAIVPVKKLQLEDANLTDEGLRVILAGLLAAKHPEILKRKRAKSSPNQPREFLRQATGIVEKLSLKNNKRITAEGWMHICLFLNMSRSIKAIDLSMIPFPQLPTVNAQEQSTRARSNSNSGVRDTAEIFRKSLAERLAGNCLEELLLAECGLSTYQLGKIIDYASTGIPILGLASNHLDHAGFAHVGRYLRSGICKGLDLGGNDLHMKMESISTNLAELRTRSHNLLWALSFANCNLTADDLEQLFPALVELPDFRLLDLSHNRGLFAGSGPTALGVLRRYLPKLPLLKRISLGDTSLTAPQAIGLADIIPECRNLIHVSLLDNPELRKVLVEAVDVAAQEEACAVYASMMTAVRLSKTLLCMDIDVPSPNASEVVKALARQVVAYLLTNIERYSEYDAIKVADAAALLPDISEVEKTAARPEILQHFLEHHEHPELHTGKTPAADEDYFVGGTGVVKALSYCLNASQLKRNSVQPETSTELLESEAGKATAKEMSKTLLESARKWRNSLQPKLAGHGEETDGDVRRMFPCSSSVVN